MTYLKTDPKLVAIRAGIERCVIAAGNRPLMDLAHTFLYWRYLGLWQARNRRVRVLMARAGKLS